MKLVLANLRVIYCHTNYLLIKILLYFAIRDKEDNYQGGIEMLQDITEILKIEGQQRQLVDREGIGASGLNIKIAL